MFPSRQTADHLRAELRLPVDSAAIVLHRGRALTARMEDFSRGGAGLSANVPPPPDAPVTLEVGDLAIAARVAWTAGRRFGLSFDSRIRATDVFLLSRQSRGQAAG